MANLPNLVAFRLLPWQVWCPMIPITPTRKSLAHTAFCNLCASLLLSVRVALRGRAIRRFPAACALLVLPGIGAGIGSGTAHAGILLDYGDDPQALNDAGIVRDVASPFATFGFAQFQAFTIDAATPAWRVDSARVRLRLFNATSGGDATLAVYSVEDQGVGLLPDLSAKLTDDLVISTDSLAGDMLTVGLGGLVLGPGTYFIGIEASTSDGEPTDLLWLAGDASANRPALRSDGSFFTPSPRALSLTLNGEIVPAPGVMALALAGAPLAVRRKRG